MTDRVVMWDFDGTLARRPGLWSTCVLEVLDEHAPGHSGSRDRIRADLKNGFPWHRADEPHPELCEPDAWWGSLDPLLGRAFSGAGIDAAEHARLAQEFRVRFVDGSVGWEVFDDTRPALQATADAGWRNVILSNHVPELPALVAALGLSDLVESVFTSAVIGYDKPHPEAFRLALRECGNPGRRWMVGDNPVADVAGAQALGIPAVLIRTEGGEPDALAAAQLVTAEAPRVLSS
jgi:putative hydrolase of the HAD superfamily